MTTGYELMFMLSAAQIILIDLVLSGDNAVVIGMATARLDPANRRKAVIFGSLGAIVLRVFFTGLAAVSLVKVPLLQFLGGLALIWIAVKLLVENNEQKEIEPQKNLFRAIKTIIAADVIMSLDNVLAVGGASHGDLTLLIFGLLFSMPLLMIGSQVVAALIARFRWLSFLGAGVLAWVAGDMIGGEKLLKGFLPGYASTMISISAIIIVLALAKIIHVRHTAGADSRGA